MPQSLSIKGLQATIGYLYLLSFCPPERVKEFQQAGDPLRTGLALEAGMSSPEDHFAQVVPEACRRIAAFHLGTRKPNERVVAALAKAAHVAHANPLSVWVFGLLLSMLARMPARAKAENRPRASKGCQFCASPCRYGFFAMVSKPNYELLHSLLEAEAQKPAQDQDPIQATWSFTTGQLWRSLGLKQGYTTADHLGNLSYCLLALGMSKSRYVLPEKELQAFQAANQARIRRYGADEQVGAGE
jgi:hypothetical protein